MYSELEKVDIIRSRFNLTYESAKVALDNAGGNVVSALAAIEKSPPMANCTDLLSMSTEVVEDIQKLVTGKPIKSLRIKYKNRLIAEKPVALTVAATVAVGVAALLISRLKIEIDRGEDEATS